MEIIMQTIKEPWRLLYWHLSKMHVLCVCYFMSIRDRIGSCSSCPNTCPLPANCSGICAPCNLLQCHAIICLQHINMDTNWLFPVNWGKALEVALRAAFGMEAVGFT